MWHQSQPLRFVARGESRLKQKRRSSEEVGRRGGQNKWLFNAFLLPYCCLSVLTFRLVPLKFSADRRQRGSSVLILSFDSAKYPFRSWLRPSTVASQDDEFLRDASYSVKDFVFWGRNSSFYSCLKVFQERPITENVEIDIIDLYINFNLNSRSKCGNSLVVSRVGKLSCNNLLNSSKQLKQSMMSPTES